MVVFGYTRGKKEIEIPDLIEGLPVTVIDDRGTDQGFAFSMRKA